MHKIRILNITNTSTHLFTFCISLKLSFVFNENTSQILHVSKNIEDINLCSK